jgi:hypothetical protein
MTPRKRRPVQHGMEEASVRRLADRLPTHWALHDYKPDYGIDTVVEVFDPVPGSDSLAEALGASFFVQVKSVAKTDIHVIRAFGRYNVEKERLRENKAEYVDLEVLKHRIDVNLLLTVQSMGAAVPVLLVLVCLDSDRIFFVCLNDLIEKVIVPLEPRFTESNSITLNIPVLNEIKQTPESLVPLRLYAQRPKLYAAFAKFAYQHRELQREYSDQLALHFLDVLLRYDFWHTTEMWTPVGDLYQGLRELQASFAQLQPRERGLRVMDLWGRLVNLNSMHEEICREWFLPTLLSRLGSYSDSSTFIASVEYGQNTGEVWNRVQHGDSG